MKGVEDDHSSGPPLILGGIFVNEIPRFKKYLAVLFPIQCNPVMMAFYNCLKERDKNGKVIVCAIMRKLVHIILNV
ncbi:MAG TPA: hypothetical protein VEK32_10060 [Thermodesulfobacteriota bacterium]|nr:hypothetical protein [Thermodesulfobacteriota bacterium]